MTNDISEVTRRGIADYLTASTIFYSGRLSDDEFLARLYDLTKLPSYDDRYRNAAGDIHQHCVNNNDWAMNWVFFDSRFNLLHVPDEEFLRFLAETIHPVVRPDGDEARQLADVYNKELAKDGWRLVEAQEISGKPVFGATRIGHVPVFAEPTGWTKVDRQLQEARFRLDTAESEEQFQAVGLLCREALISVSQEVFKHLRHPTGDGIAPSDTDVKRKLDAVFDAELNGSANEEARAHAKAAVRLALALQHKRAADFRTAALCTEGTFSVVNMLAILAGRRGRTVS
jgi:hypothetical protein